MKRECDEARFLSDTKDHLMTVFKDDGVHRFVRFKKESSTTYWFDLITWPGYLCVSGDCGTYVFSRLHDMFEFFRNPKKESTLSINPRYWGEKLEATGRDGYMKYDADVFAQRVKDHFENYMVEDIQDIDLKDEIWEAIQDRVISNSYDGEHRAYDSVYNFSFTSDDGEEFRFIDFFDAGATEVYSFQYIWCLFAIVWGIRKYDESKINVIGKVA